jgi:hypothetical protein
LATPTVNAPSSDPKVDSRPPENKNVPVRESLHYKLVITLYRVFAITVLYLVLAGIVRNLQLVVNPDTAAAFDFHNQLTAAQLLLEIETGDARFRIERVREYLTKNY